MDIEKLTEFVDQQRWLLNNGLVSDSVKNQLFMLGSIAHPEVQAVEVKILTEEKCVEYTLYLTKKTLKKMQKYYKLSTSTSLFGMWKFKRFLKKEGSMNFQAILNSYIKDFCGPSWSTKLTIIDFDVYLDQPNVDQ
jgi:glucosamine 6-phosphate synthetase-like amidotransferase/phosphosugar isomerase protein